MKNNISDELSIKFKNIYLSSNDVLEEHTKYLLIFLKNNPITKLIINSLEQDKNYKIWEPIESKYTIGYDDYNLPDNEKGMAALSLFLLEELVNEPKLLFCRHHNNIKTEDFVVTIKDLFVRKLEEYIYINIKHDDNMLYLLHRYKYLCEWFTKEKLIKTYENETPKGENNLTKDLREFLFHNGIDYPFSEPNSPSGNIDLIYGLNTDTPLTLEIKLYGGKNNYNKKYIRQGFRQAIEYAKDYNQEYAYLFVYNLKDEIIEIENDSVKSNIISINHANKIIYIIIANLKTSDESASKLKNMKIEKISKEYLISE